MMALLQTLTLISAYVRSMPSEPPPPSAGATQNVVATPTANSNGDGLIIRDYAAVLPSSSGGPGEVQVGTSNGVRAIDQPAQGRRNTVRFADDIPVSVLYSLVYASDAVADGSVSGFRFFKSSLPGSSLTSSDPVPPYSARIPEEEPKPAYVSQNMREVWEAAQERHEVARSGGSRSSRILCTSVLGM